MPEQRAENDPDAAEARRHRRRSGSRAPMARLARALGHRPAHQVGLLVLSVLVAGAALAASMTGRGALPGGQSPAGPGRTTAPGAASLAPGRALPGDLDGSASGARPTLPALATPAASDAAGGTNGGAGTPARRIRVARLGIDLAIVEGDGIDAPATKAAHYPGTAWPGAGGNIYLYAHARAGLFLPLWEARVGDTVTLDLADGRSATYTVRQVLPRVPWNALEYTEATPKEQLTLQTCTGTGVEVPRFIVIAEPG